MWRGLFAVAVLVVPAACAATEARPAAGPAAAGTTAPSAVPSTVASATSAPVTTVVPPPAPASVVYDNSAASRACTLLAPTEIAAQFGPTADGMAIDPYCWWKVGEDGFVALTIFEKRPLSSFRAYSGLVVGDVPDVGDGAFFASNKTLFFGVGGTTYDLQFERGAEWIDANRPKLVALALQVLDRLGFVAPPKPTTTTTTTTPPPPADPNAPPTIPTTTTTTLPKPTTTTTRPKPPPVLPPAAAPRPTAALDLRRPLGPTAPLRIWAGGDSIAGGPAWAVGEAARATGHATVDSEFQVGTGLSRPDFFDWYRHLAAVADARDPDVMVLLFGGNDIQPLDIGGVSVAYGDPAWSAEYRARVARIMDNLATRGRRVIWVGTPAMSDPTFNAQMAVLNDIYASEAAARAPWVSYVDAWTMFSPVGQPGVFARELPDAAGVMQVVRFDDIHYNVPGSELLAAALLDRMRTFSNL